MAFEKTPARSRRRQAPTAETFQLAGCFGFQSRTLSHTGRAIPFRFDKDGQNTEISTGYCIGINEIHAHLAACIAGPGIAQTFTYGVQDALCNGTLVEILKAWRTPPYPFQVVYPHHRHMTQRLRVFSIFQQNSRGGGAEGPARHSLVPSVKLPHIDNHLRPSMAVSRKTVGFWLVAVGRGRR